MDRNRAELERDFHIFVGFRWWVDGHELSSMGRFWCGLPCETWQVGYLEEGMSSSAWKIAVKLNGLNRHELTSYGYCECRVQQSPVLSSKWFSRFNGCQIFIVYHSMFGTCIGFFGRSMDIHFIRLQAKNKHDMGLYDWINVVAFTHKVSFVLRLF